MSLWVQASNTMKMLILFANWETSLQAASSQTFSTSSTSNDLNHGSSIIELVDSEASSFSQNFAEELVEVSTEWDGYNEVMQSLKTHPGYSLKICSLLQDPLQLNFSSILVLMNHLI